MTNSTSPPSKVFASREQVTAALERAAERARAIAVQTGTQLIVSLPPVQSPASKATTSQKSA